MPKYIGPKREKKQVCLTKLVFTPFSLKVAWSGKSIILLLFTLSTQPSMQHNSYVILVMFGSGYVESVMSLSLNSVTSHKNGIENDVTVTSWMGEVVTTPL